MDYQSQANFNRMSNDIHLLTMPFRWALQMIAVTLATICAPLILVGLLYGIHGRDENICFLVKFLIFIFGPLMFSIWFIIVVGWRETMKNGGVRDGATGRAAGRMAYFLVVSYIGLAVSQMNWYGGETSVWLAVLGLFSPVILYIPWRLLTAD